MSTSNRRCHGGLYHLRLFCFKVSKFYFWKLIIPVTVTVLPDEIYFVTQKTCDWNLVDTREHFRDIILTVRRNSALVLDRKQSVANFPSYACPFVSTRSREVLFVRQSNPSPVERNTKA
jgi:hypothetical protein